MTEIFEQIRENPLFEGIRADEFEALSRCMEARRRSYQKDEVILLSGDAATAIGLVLDGSVQIIREAADGKQIVMAELPAPELFGEVFACAGVTQMPVTVLAAQDCEILFLNYRKMRLFGSMCG